MFRPEPLHRVQLVLLASEAQDAALQLAHFGEFNPLACKDAAFTTASMDAYREAWLQADSRLQKLLDYCGEHDTLRLDNAMHAPSLDDLHELNRWLRVTWAECMDNLEQTRQSDAACQHLTALNETLHKLTGLNVDLAELLRPTSLLAVRIGSLPAQSVARVRDALSLTSHILTDFGGDDELAYAVIAGPRLRENEIRALLLQAGWQELEIPQELQRHPNEARLWLEQRADLLAQQQAQEQLARTALCASFAMRLQEARQRLALARPLVELATTGVCGNSQLLALAGWVPQARLADLHAMLDSSLQGRYWLELREPAADEKLKVPSLVRYPFWLKPFLPMVSGYGIARYGEFDPVLPFGFIYLLLFGAMFGDIGHGAVILVLSLLLVKRFGPLLWVGVAAGAMSMVFGVLYGSIFGYEELFEPLWLSPLHAPLQVLTIAILFGVCFISLTMLISVRNAWASGQYGKALFDASGLAGLLFYLGAVGGLLSLTGLLDLADPAWALAIVGLTLVALYKWHEVKSGIAERLLVTLIETVETGVNLFSNTLSFMRVAAFSLNHVALALAVFTLAASMGAVGHWLTLVLGNIVIIVLEGAIVAIQALRLLYYEGFSRFFHGDGVEFAPLQLQTAGHAATEQTSTEQSISARTQRE